MYVKNPNAHDLNLNAVFIHLLISFVHQLINTVGTLVQLGKIEVVISVVFLVLTVLLSYNLLELSGRVLLQGISLSDVSLSELKKLKKNINYVDGVLYINSAEFWSVAPGYSIAYVSVNIREDSSSGKVNAEIKKLLQKNFEDIYVESYKDKD